MLRPRASSKYKAIFSTVLWGVGVMLLNMDFGSPSSTGPWFRMLEQIWF